MADRRPPATTVEPVPPLAATTLAVEVAEEAGARFDEMCNHVTGRREFADLELEPVRPLPMVERLPGTFVWSRRGTVRPAGSSARASARGASGFTVFFAVVPGTEEAVDPTNPETAVVGLKWSDLAFAEPIRGTPRSLLMIRADAPRFVPVARSFGERLRTELENEAD